MADGAFVIFAGDEVWRIGSSLAMDELRFDRDTSAPTIAAAVAAKLHDRGYQGRGVLLALPSAWCLAAPISTADLPRQDAAAMAFRLEEKLPLAAEHFTADFVITGDRALGVCIANDRSRPLVDALERAGAVVQSVSPAVMLAIQSAAAAAALDGTQLILWGEASAVNVVSLQSGRPTAWALVPADFADLSLQIDLALMELGGDTPVIAHELSADLTNSISQDNIEIPDGGSHHSLTAVVIADAPAILSGKRTPWFELRRGAMAIDDPLRVTRRAINAALATAAVFFLVLAGTFLYRSIRYDHLAQTYDARLADDFKREFPDLPLSPNLKRTIESERAKLTLAGSSALPSQAQESALNVLRDVLAKVPPDGKINIERMAFNDTSLELDGRTKAGEDVDILVTAARDAGMDVAPPQMRKLPGSAWSFAVRGTKPVKAAAASAGGRE